MANISVQVCAEERSAAVALAQPFELVAHGTVPTRPAFAAPLTALDWNVQGVDDPFL